MNEHDSLPVTWFHFEGIHFKFLPIHSLWCSHAFIQVSITSDERIIKHYLKVFLVHPGVSIHTEFHLSPSLISINEFKHDKNKFQELVH